MSDPEIHFIQNNGKLAFQVKLRKLELAFDHELTVMWKHVGHVHFHVIPKPNQEEGLVLNLDDNWPFKAANKEDLAKIADKMKTTIGAWSLEVFMWNFHTTWCDKQHHCVTIHVLVKQDNLAFFEVFVFAFCDSSQSTLSCRARRTTQRVYTKSGCRSPNSTQAFKPASSPSFSSTVYFSSSFARTPGRFLTLFLHDRYVLLMRAPTATRMVLKN